MLPITIFQDTHGLMETEGYVYTDLEFKYEVIGVKINGEECKNMVIGMQLDKSQIALLVFDLEESPYYKEFLSPVKLKHGQSIYINDAQNKLTSVELYVQDR